MKPKNDQITFNQEQDGNASRVRWKASAEQLQPTVWHKHCVSTDPWRGGSEINPAHTDMWPETVLHTSWKGLLTKMSDKEQNDFFFQKWPWGK